MEHSKLKEYQELWDMLQKCIPAKSYLSPDMFVLNDYIRKTEKKGYTKPFGAKALAQFKDKIQVVNIGDGEYIIYKNTAVTKQGKTAFEVLMVQEFKTPRGKHYMVENRDRVYIFTSHFLDRLQERQSKTNTREQALADFVELMTKEGYHKIQLIEHPQEQVEIPAEFYLQEGMGLGRGFIIDDKMVLYMQTFVTLDMLYPNQKQRHKEAYKNVA
jgi:hypothetical protein